MIRDAGPVVRDIPEHKLRFVKAWKEYFEDNYFEFITDSTNY